MRAALLHLAAASLCAGADLILTNAKVVTADPAFSTKQAIAITGNRIEAVGTARDIAKLRTATTRVIDLAGATVVPGLIDSHVHAYSAGLSEFRAKLPPFDSFAAIQDYLHTASVKLPPDAWIVVPRTFPTRLKEMKIPTRDVHDAEVSEHNRLL